MLEKQLGLLTFKFQIWWMIEKTNIQFINQDLYYPSAPKTA